MGGDKRLPRLAARLPAETKLADLVKRHFGGYDRVICEGYRRKASQVIEVRRAEAGYAEMESSPAPLA